MISSFLSTSDGTSVAFHGWPGPPQPRAVIQIVHGMAEHAGRYATLAGELNAARYAVYAGDHRGHGRTAKSADALGHLGDADGWRDCLDDLALVRGRIDQAHPGVPVVMLGHSMGSFLAQQYAGEQSAVLAGLILTGSYRQPRWLARAGAALARLERLRLGGRGRSALIHALTLGGYNRPFTPSRTPVDWLSRDAVAVDLYTVDPLCGIRPTVQTWIELLGILGAGFPPLPAELPVCLLAGENDAVAAPDPGARRLAAALAGGMKTTLFHRVYPGARHELFHETNREEVVHDLITWLDGLPLSR